MELKVWVEGILRVISGVDETTTCQMVVYALANATKRTGRFVLIEKWRNSTRLLAPQECPLKILNKLGEYSGEVQFILQKSEKSSENLSVPSQKSFSDSISENHQKEVENVGIIKGIQQTSPPPPSQSQSISSPKQENCEMGENNTISLDNNKNADIATNRSSKTKPPPYIPPPKVLKSTEKILPNPDDLLVKDLIQLLKLQREKIVNQQNDLAKFDAEIIYLERRSREQLQLEKHHLELITQEILQQSEILQQGNEQLNLLKHIEEEKESAFLQESSMKAETGYLKSKINVLETELLQCKNKLKQISNEIQLEQKHYNQQQFNSVLEQKIMAEIEKLKSDIELAQMSSDSITKSTEALKNEVFAIEMSIIEKKKQLEKLIQEMKQVNLESLSSPDEYYCPPKESRKIIGSPRQLENAVATSKNPHGVWV